MKRYRIILAEGMIITGVKADSVLEGADGFYFYQKYVNSENTFLVAFAPKTAVIVWDNSENIE